MLYSALFLHAGDLFSKYNIESASYRLYWVAHSETRYRQITLYTSILHIRARTYRYNYIITAMMQNLFRLT